MRLRSEENEVNDKGGREGGGGLLSQVCAAPTGYGRCFSVLGFCDIAIDFRQFWSLIGNGLR